MEPKTKPCGPIPGGFILTHTHIWRPASEQPATLAGWENCELCDSKTKPEGSTPTQRKVGPIWMMTILRKTMVVI